MSRPLAARARRIVLLGTATVCQVLPASRERCKVPSEVNVQRGMSLVDTSGTIRAFESAAGAATFSADILATASCDGSFALPRTVSANWEPALASAISTGADFRAALDLVSAEALSSALFRKALGKGSCASPVDFPCVIAGSKGGE